LKRLAGTWTGRVTTDPRNPEIDGDIQVTMRVASRGNVLIVVLNWPALLLKR